MEQRLSVEKGRYEFGSYAQAKLNYLKERHEGMFHVMQLTGTIDNYLQNVEKECENAYESIFKEMLKNEGVTELLKKANHAEWVRRMNSVQNRAREIIMSEYIYCDR